MARVRNGLTGIYNSTPLTLGNEEGCALAVDASGRLIISGVANNAADSGNPVKVGGVYNSTPITLDNGDRGDMQLDSRGHLKVAGGVADNAADSGDPLKVGAKYNASAQTYDDGDRTNLQADVNGNLLESLGTKVAGEDLTNDVLKVEERFSYFAPIVADAQIKSGAGYLHSVTISCNDAAPTAGSIIIYDSLTETGTQIFNHTFTTTPFVPTTIFIDASFATGLYIGFTTTADVNVQGSYR